MRATNFLLTCFCGIFFTGMLALPAFGAEDSARKPETFACEIRYHFREHVRGAKAGEKRVSAPSHEREVLPLSRATTSKGASAQLIEGRVRHLPYRFVVKIVRRTDAGRETLEVNIRDRSGKSLAGFPQAMPNPLSRTVDSSRKDFEIPVSKSLKKKIERSLLARDQFLTYVNLIVGVDDDFVSSAAPR
jgi:hypothetical protein